MKIYHLTFVVLFICISFHGHAKHKNASYPDKRNHNFLDSVSTKRNEPPIQTANSPGHLMDNERYYYNYIEVPSVKWRGKYHTESIALTKMTVSSSVIRGFREMGRGFRELEQHESLFYDFPKPEASNHETKIYPNPAVNWVNIDLNEASSIETIELYDNSGVLKGSWNINAFHLENGTLRINTEGLCSGSYTVKLLSNTAIIKPLRLIIKK